MKYSDYSPEAVKVRNNYVNQYKREHYKRVVLEIRKEDYATLETISKEKELTPNNYIRELINKEVKKYTRAKRKEK